MVIYPGRGSSDPRLDREASGGLTWIAAQDRRLNWGLGLCGPDFEGLEP
jgi:hypothetical protein